MHLSIYLVIICMCLFIYLFIRLQLITISWSKLRTLFVQIQIRFSHHIYQMNSLVYIPQNLLIKTVSLRPPQSMYYITLYVCVHICVCMYVWIACVFDYKTIFISYKASMTRLSLFSLLEYSHFSNTITPIQNCGSSEPIAGHFGLYIFNTLVLLSVYRAQFQFT